MSFPGWSTTVFLFCDSCSWFLHWSWAVQLPAVLQKNTAHSLVFQHLLHIWTFSKSDCMILRSIFSHWGQLRDSYATITEGSNAHRCSRRKKHALRWKLRGENFLNLKIRVNWTYFVFWETCNYLPYPLKGSTKWKNMIFRQNKKKIDSPPALNAWILLLEHQWAFEPSVIVAYESLSCPQRE